VADNWEDRLDGPPDIVLEESDLNTAIAQYLDRNYPTPEGAQSYDIRLRIVLRNPISADFKADVWYSDKEQRPIEKQVDING
jgi:hypothetical protein